MTTLEIIDLSNTELHELIMDATTELIRRESKRGEGKRIAGLVAEDVSEPETIEHQGMTLRKVERPSMTGDFVRFSGMPDGRRTTNGKLYEVIENNRYLCDDNSLILNVYGWKKYCEKPEMFEVVERRTFTIKSNNLQRYNTIMQARVFVESKFREGNHNVGKVVDYVGGGNKVKFIVNEEKRTIVTLLSLAYVSGKVLRGRGIAKCHPNEVFNSDIGKAISLARALKIDVPKEFVEAVQPDEVVVGMKLGCNKEYDGCHFEDYTVGRVHHDDYKMVTKLRDEKDSGSWARPEAVIILDDSKAVYDS